MNTLNDETMVMMANTTTKTPYEVVVPGETTLGTKGGLYMDNSGTTIASPVDNNSHPVTTTKSPKSKSPKKDSSTTKSPKKEKSIKSPKKDGSTKVKKSKSTIGELKVLTSDLSDGMGASDNAVVVLIKELTNTLRTSEDASELLAAFDQLSELCTEAAKNQSTEYNDYLLDCNTPQVIVQTLTMWQAKSESVITQGLAALHNSALMEYVAIAYVLEHNGWDTVLECMKLYPHNLYLQTRGCGAIGTMTRLNDTDKIKDIMMKECLACTKHGDDDATTCPSNNNTIRIILDAMKNHSDDYKLQRWALRAIHFLTIIPELKEHYVEQNMLVPLATAIEMNRKSKHEYTKDINHFAWSSLLQLQECEKEEE